MLNGSTLARDGARRSRHPPRHTLGLTRIGVAAACAAAAISFASPHHHDAGASDETPALAQPLDLGPTLAQSCEKYKIPAMAAAAVRDGALWGIGAAGVRQSGQAAKVGPNDRWYIGSCGRAMTAILAGVLVDQGKITWDSTVADVLPEVAQTAREEYRTVTLAQLLRNRSGLPADPGADSPIWKLIRSAKGPMVERRITVAKIALRQEPAGSADAHRRDSALGYVVAGAMLEAAGGAAFEDLVRERVFSPLGMESAGFGPPGTPGVLDEPVGHAAGLAGWLRPLPPNDPSYDPPVMAPAGTVHCSIGDWAKFAQFNLRGARAEPGLLISPESFKMIQTDMVRRNRAAMGWSVAARAWAGGALLVHEEEGPWYASIWVCPKANVAYVVATNRGDQDGALAGNEALGAMISRNLADAE